MLYPLPAPVLDDAQVDDAGHQPLQRASLTALDLVETAAIGTSAFCIVAAIERGRRQLAGAQTVDGTVRPLPAGEIARFAALLHEEGTRSFTSDLLGDERQILAVTCETSILRIAAGIGREP